MLTERELQRYDRQMMIYGFGEDGQEKLQKAKVFIAGVGGLGSPVAIYLAVAGIGTIRIVDHDTVELSNLNRQVLHWDENIGGEKAASAVAKLQKLNPDVRIEAISETITDDNASQLVGDSDLIVDAMDNLPTRYLLNKTAIEKGIPFFHGAVYGFEGRAMTVIPGKSACLNCLYHGADAPKEKFPVIGVTPAVIGCIQATEVIKYLTGLGELLTNRLLNYDALSMKFTEFKVNRDPNCEHCGNL
ncbi:MAG: HesA/MoeB/ThiF family protein [Dehalococcoidales bacterium]|nr:HesA/MoeB/ThiF family protein [Dehalococcoidales bacterium]